MRARRKAKEPVVYKEEDEESSSAISSDGDGSDEYTEGLPASPKSDDQAADSLGEDGSDLDSIDSDDLDKEESGKRGKKISQVIARAREVKGELLPKVVSQVSKLKPSNVARRDGTIHPDTMDFLIRLAANNERDWFWANEPLYRSALSDWKSFVDAIVPRMIEEVDDSLPMLPSKDLVHRIARDIRFSNDRTPFKRNLSFGMSRTGRKGPWAGWYVHIMPNNRNLVAAGLWQPEKNDLARIRHGIQQHPEALREVISRQDFIDHFGEPKPPPPSPKKPTPKKRKGKDDSDEEDGAVQSRPKPQRGGNMALKGKRTKAASDEESAEDEEFSPRCSIFGHKDMLKVAPVGVSKDHPDIDLLRLRTIAVVEYLTDEVVLSNYFAEKLLDVMKVQAPLVRTLNSYLSPDDPEDNGG